MRQSAGPVTGVGRPPARAASALLLVALAVAAPCAQAPAVQAPPAQEPPAQASAAQGPPPQAPSTPALPVDPAARAWSALGLRWSVAFETRPAAPPAFDAHMAFAPLADGTLAAVDLERGAPRWRIDIAVSSTPAVGGGRVFVASEGDIVAVEAASGAEVWRVSLPGTLAAPLDWDTGWLLASTTDGDLAAFRAQDGELLWRAGVGAPIAAGPSPALDRLYAGLDDGRVIAVDLATGAVRWERRLAGRITGLAAFDDQLITGTTENEVLSLGLVRGEQRWRIRVGGDPVGPASADDRHIYFAALDNVLRAVDRGSGNLRWMQPLPSRPSAGPLLVGTAVFVPFVSTALNAFAAADGKPLYAISASGELAGRPHLRTAGFITGARLVTMSRDGHLRGFGEAMEAPPAPLAVLPGVSVGG